MALSGAAEQTPRQRGASLSERRALSRRSDQHRHIFLLMTLKHLLGLVLILLAIPVISATTTFSRRARELAFFLMLSGWVVTDRMDIHFFSFDLYRGSTRGVEISALDILGFGVLIGQLFAPAPGQKRWFWPASLGFMIFYFLYCCISVALST